MIADYIPSDAEFGPSGHREDASHFIKGDSIITTIVLFQQMVGYFSWMIVFFTILSKNTVLTNAWFFKNSLFQSSFLEKRDGHFIRPGEYTNASFWLLNTSYFVMYDKNKVNAV